METQIVNNKFEYKFDSKNSVLFKYYYGEITLSDITSSWEAAISNKEIPTDTKGFILDYRKASFKLNNGEHISIAEYYKHNNKIFGDKKIAIVTESYKDIIVPILVKAEDPGCHFEPFSTIGAATGWVLS